MKKLLVAVLIVISIQANAQNTYSKFDLRFGVGPTWLSTGDLWAVSFENELNYTINKYLCTSISAAYGKSLSGLDESAAFVQGNVNIFISPFKNSNKNDFRLGTGISYVATLDAYLRSRTYENGIITDEEYNYDNTKSIGMSVIVEDTYTIRNKFMLGVKLFTQPYKNGDINSGVRLKFGIKI